MLNGNLKNYQKISHNNRNPDSKKYLTKYYSSVTGYFTAELSFDWLKKDKFLVSYFVNWDLTTVFDNNCQCDNLQ